MSAETRDIFLEAAHFSPLAVAGQARTYGLHTDASHRFERGVDPELAREAAERATTLLLQITGGEAGPLVEVADASRLPGDREVVLRRARLDQALDKVLPAEEVSEILERLGMVVETSDEGWRARVPSWRFDIAIEEDSSKRWRAFMATTSCRRGILVPILARVRITKRVHRWPHCATGWSREVTSRR